MLPDYTTLPPHLDEVRGRRKVDMHYLLFGLNVLLVLLGYFFSIKYNSLNTIKVIRIVVMAVSFAYLLGAWRSARFVVDNLRHGVIGIFIIANLAIVPFSVITSVSLDRLLTVIPFWLYINVFAFYLRGRYGPSDGLRRMVWLFAIVYLFPVVVFFVSGNPFSRLNIYGDFSTGFYSNQLGWACALALSCLIDIRSRLSPRKIYVVFWLGAMAISFWLLLISGSRSSYLSIAATVLLLLTASRVLNWFPKLIISMLVVGGVYVLLSVQDSAINQRLQKTQDQLEQVEARVLSARQAFHALELHEERYVTGLGFDLYNYGIQTLTGVDTFKAHNSYFELFVDCGAIVFGLFILLFFIPTVVRYAAFDAKQFSFLPPILIIPYFENNIGAGQFIFFPWMFVFFWYIHDVRSARDFKG